MIDWNKKNKLKILYYAPHVFLLKLLSITLKHTHIYRERTCGFKIFKKSKS